MGGFLDFITAAIPGAVAARSGYLQGQEQRQKEDEARKRQTLLDQIEHEIKKSQIDENNARADYYRSGGPRADGTPVTYKLGEDGQYIALPTRLGSTRGAAGSATAAAPSTTPSTTGEAKSSDSLLSRMFGNVDENSGGRMGDYLEGAAAGSARSRPCSTSSKTRRRQLKHHRRQHPHPHRSERRPG
jgi:hypothetical protein